MGYIGLIYYSDIIYASSKNANSSRAYCIDNGCGVNWMTNFSNSSYSYYTLSPSPNDYSACHIFSVGSYVGRDYAYLNRVVKPVLYLNKDTFFVSGDGSASSPYVLAMFDIKNIYIKYFL